MVTEVKQGLTKNNKPYAFLNFGDWRKLCFTVVLWSEVLSMLLESGKKPSDFVNKWVAVTGLITIYENDFGSKPEVILDSPTDIEIISEEQAKSRLNPDRGNEMGKKDDAVPQVVDRLSSRLDFYIPKLEISPPKVKEEAQSIKKNTQSEIKPDPLNQQSSISEKLNRLYADSSSTSKTTRNITQPTPTSIPPPPKTELGFWGRVVEKLNKLFSEK